METLAIISQLSVYALSLLAVALCVTLFRRSQQPAWLFVSVVFIQPLCALVIRAIHGRPLLHFMSAQVSPDGLQRIRYTVEFPVFSLVAIIGLFILVRKIQHERPVA
jgi:TRAP-type mannitol/chloroaromatic compound transport system permease small subunit